MSTNHQLTLGPLPVQSVSQTRENSVPRSVQEVSLTLLLAAAVVTAGCAEKEAALTQGYEPSYWSRIKAGEKAAHLDRVSRLPVAVQKEFLKAWAVGLRLRVSEEDIRARVIADLARAAVNALSEIA